MSPETAHYIDELKAVHGEVETLSKFVEAVLVLLKRTATPVLRRPWNGTRRRGEVCLAAGCDVELGDESAFDLQPRGIAQSLVFGARPAHGSHLTQVLYAVGHRTCSPCAGWILYLPAMV